MSVPPSVSSARGQLVLQPEYFTSNFYVENLRRDISSLLDSYREHYSKSSEHPFALFKRIWLSQRWQWLLFRVFDSRSRETFLNVTLRMFLEKAVPTEDELTRTAALFGVYTFFYSQPKETAPPLYFVSHIPIPIDHYSSLRELPGLLTNAELQPLRPYAVVVLSMLIKDKAFYILPRAVLAANKPRELPREVVTDGGTPSSMDTGKRKRGRPSKHDKERRGKEALEKLEKLLKNNGRLLNDPTVGDDYPEQKRQVLNRALSTEEGSNAVQRASETVLEGLRRAQEIAAGSSEEKIGLGWAERANREAKGGLLALT